MFSQKIIGESRTRLEASLGIELRDYSLDEVAEFQWRLRDVDVSDVSALPDDVQRYIFNEINLSKIDFRYWAARYCYILSAEKQLITLSNLWPGQEKLLQTLAVEEEAALEREDHAKMRVIILKARQLGQTAICEALMSHGTFLQPKTQAIIASDHPDNTLKLWQTLLRMYDNLPAWMRPRQDAKPKAQNLHLADLDSDIVYGSGNQKTTLGQGMTVDYVHLTEVSTWIPECTRGIESDLSPAFESSRKHHSLIILESTGNGARGNYFHDIWHAAVKGDSTAVPIFMPWYMRPDWSMNSEGITIDEDTLNMNGRVLRETGQALSKDQIAWWQTKKRELASKDMLEVFYAEFPSTVDEAFQTGLKSAFSIELRTKIRDNVRRPVDVYDWNFNTKKFRQLDVEEWIASEDYDKWTNKLVVWERKKPGYIYVVGVDASHGVEGGDNAAIEVLRVGNIVSPDEQVAEWCGNLSAIHLADLAWFVGHIFCELPDAYPAMLAIEVNPGSPGIVTQTELMRRNYPNFFRWRRPLADSGRYTDQLGWYTTPSTRPLVIERGLHALKEGDLVVNSPPFVDEMKTFVNIPTPSDLLRGRRHFTSMPGYHDDRLMALFIALECSHFDDLRDLAAERRKFSEQRVQKDVRQFQEMSGRGWDDMIQRWEDALIDPYN